MRTLSALTLIGLLVASSTGPSFADLPVQGDAAYKLIEEQYHLKLDPSTIPGVLGCINQHLQPGPNYWTYSVCVADHPLYAVIIGRQGAGMSEDLVRGRIAGYMIKNNTPHDPYVCGSPQHASSTPPALDAAVTDCSLRIYFPNGTVDATFSILMLHTSKVNPGYADVYIAVLNANRARFPDLPPSLQNIAAHLRYTGS